MIPRYSFEMKTFILTFLVLFTPSIVLADKPSVTKVNATQSGGVWRFDVTVLHGDVGWEHYADGWGVYLPNGSELGYRVLHHPHVDEMPFTRSLGGIKIPDGTTSVTVVPRDLVHGEGEGYKVKLTP